MTAKPAVPPVVDTDGPQPTMSSATSTSAASTATRSCLRPCCAASTPCWRAATACPRHEGNPPRRGHGRAGRRAALGAETVICNHLTCILVAPPALMVRPTSSPVAQSGSGQVWTTITMTKPIAPMLRQCCCYKKRISMGSHQRIHEHKLRGLEPDTIPGTAQQSKDP